MVERLRPKLESTYPHAGSNRPVLSWLFGLLVVLTFVGYPIAGALAQILSLPNTAASYPFRGLILTVSIGIILVGVMTVRYRIALPILAFLLIYLARLVVDSEGISFPDADRDLLFYIAAVLIPTLGVGVSDVYDERRTIILLSWFGGLACALIIYGLQNNVVGATGLDFSRRANFDSLNPITIGYTGIYTALAGVGILKHANRKWKFALAAPLIVAGLAVLVLGGSRGPFVGMLLFLALYALVHRHGLLALAMFVAFGYGLYATVGQDLALVQRLENSSNDASIWNRIYVQQASWEVAVQNPLLGFSYLEPSSLAYPHNLLIESGMALGIFGFFLMLIILTRLIFDSFTLLRHGHLLVPFVAISAFANANLSASIFQSNDFWLIAMFSWMAAKRIRSNKFGIWSQSIRHRDETMAFTTS